MSRIIGTKLCSLLSSCSDDLVGYRIQPPPYPMIGIECLFGNVFLLPAPSCNPSPPPLEEQKRRSIFTRKCLCFSLSLPGHVQHRQELGEKVGGGSQNFLHCKLGKHPDGRIGLLVRQTGDNRSRPLIRGGRKVSFENRIAERILPLQGLALALSGRVDTVGDCAKR